MIRVATRERILHAALTVFARKGYHRALVDDIVRASRTSKGAVYHHFPNKEAILDTVSSLALARLRRHGALRAPRADARRTLDAAIDEAARLAAEAAQPRTDLRGTEEYKRNTIRVFTGRALRKVKEELS